MRRFGFLEQAEGILLEAGFEAVQIIDGVEPNPTVGTVWRGARELLEFEPDWIVAIGGGSALDAAKIMWCFYEHPELDFKDIVPIAAMPPLRQKARFVAIPSTSGTASEVTAFSVITDPEAHVKIPIVSPEIVPDIAILDPALPAKMPPHVTANTGMDALSHAVESYVSTGASDFTKPLALAAIKMVFEALPIAYREPNNLLAREKMHNASTIAGQAFSNSSLGLVHAMAHKAGGEFGITHGLCNAILMPYVIAYNKAHTSAYAELEAALGIRSIEDAIAELQRQVEIPNRLHMVQEVSIKEANFNLVLDRMSENAWGDPCRLTNPGDPTVQDIRGIYLAAF